MNEALSKVVDRAVTRSKDEQVAALGQRCRQALGPAFDKVYGYLSRVRGAAGAQPDERDVQRALLELVGGNRALLPGCFMCDQLVFQECLYARH